jgi:hypothetical protein
MSTAQTKSVSAPTSHGFRLATKARATIRTIGPTVSAAAQGLDLDAIALELASRVTQSLGTGATASHRVLGEGALIEGTRA